MRALASLVVGVTATACGGATSPPSRPASPLDSARPAASATPASPTSPPSSHPAYPATRRDATFDQIHGVAVADPYRWLEDAASPEVQAWMTAQHAVTRAYLDRLPRREQIAARIAELSYFDA